MPHACRQIRSDLLHEAEVSHLPPGFRRAGAGYHSLHRPPHR